MPLDFRNQDAIRSLDAQQEIDWKRGWQVIDTASGSNLVSEGSGSHEVDVASGDINAGGSTVTCSSATLDLAGDVDPDQAVMVIVYRDASGNAQTDVSSAETRAPSGASVRGAYDPTPNTLYNTDAVVLAEVLLEADANAVASEHIRDRRMPASLDVDSVNSQSVTTEYLTGSYTDLLRVITDGGVQTVDPSNTTTPVQDAIDISSTNGGGTVRLPPKSIDSPGGISLASDVALRGHWRSSEINITDNSNHGLILDNVAHVTLDGFQIKGSVTGSVSNAIHFGSSAGSSGQIIVPRLRVQQWRGPAIDDGGGTSVFDSWWGYCRFHNVDAGDQTAIIDLSNSSQNNNVVCWSINGSDSDTASDSEAIRFGGSECWNFGSLNLFGTANRIFVGGNAIVRVGHINYEVTSGSESEAAVWIGSPRLCLIGGVLNQSDPDYVYRLANSANAIVGPTNGGTTTNIVKIHASPNSECWYWGQSGDIDNAANATTERVWALADGKVGDPAFSSSVTLSGAASPAHTASGALGTEGDVGRVQDLSVTSGAGADYGFSYRWEWDNTNGQWDLIFEWDTDPGSGNDVTADLEVVTKGIGR